MTKQAKPTVKIDRINQAIIKRLQFDARISNADLAKEIGLSPSACLQRVRALEESGVIQYYATEMDVNRLCEMVQVYMLITLERHSTSQFQQLEDCISAEPAIVDCMKMAGEFDYIAYAVCPDISAVNDLCGRLLDGNHFVQNIRLSFIVKRTKWFAGYPLDTLRWKEVEESE